MTSPQNPSPISHKCVNRRYVNLNSRWQLYLAECLALITILMYKMPQFKQNLRIFGQWYDKIAHFKHVSRSSKVTCLVFLSNHLLVRTEILYEKSLYSFRCGVHNIQYGGPLENRVLQEKCKNLVMRFQSPLVYEP